MSPLTGTPRLDDQVCFALYRASRALIRSYGPLLDPLGITYSQYLTLMVLWEEDHLSIKRLGERLTLDSATLTPLVKRLEQQGLVSRQRDEDDERVVRVSLTRSGRALKDKAAGFPTHLACQIGGAANTATLTRIGRLRDELRALADTLEAGDAE